MEENVWGFPVIKSQTTNYDYIHWKAKLHCYDNEGVSLCKRHTQQPEDYMTYDLEEHIEEFGEKSICPICLKKYRKNNKKRSK